LTVQDRVLQTKRKKIIILTVCAILVSMLSYIAFAVLRDVYKMSWYDFAEGRVGQISEWVKIFKRDHGRFPTSFNDPSWTEDELEKKALDSILNDEFKVHYQYLPLSNGFTIIVVEQTGGFLRKAYRTEKSYIGPDAEYGSGVVIHQGK
jgi:hypothetical protein